jgi:hypothetical protein
MSVSSADVFVPAPLATATRLSAKASDCSWLGMNAPEPDFTSSTKPSRPAASFLDRIEAVMRSIALHRRGDIADAVKALVGGGERRRLADDGAAAGFGHLCERSHCRAAWCSRGWNPSCPACRRYGRDHARKSSAHSRRKPPQSARASARGCRQHRRWNVCRELDRPGATSPSTSPESRMASVSATRSSICMPWKKTAMAKLEICASVTSPLVMPSTRKAISSAVSVPPSRFLAMSSCGRKAMAKPRPNRRRGRAEALSIWAQWSPRHPWSRGVTRLRPSCRHRDW